MVKIGMMIGDRYEILEKIGTGGMADVYRAKDHKLNRQVAVKILKQEFSENENFVSKFRTEAQAAAGLMHPNIINIYDVGDENGIYYIVMELVEGITLKKYIEKKSRLTVKEAVSIAIQVAMGLEAAHNNHIIHRDIKPQNIMISKEGKVKVTDFGIAKAATSNTITSNVMGSVHYTSPEQARGGYSDAKSDVYSLGVTLFEMLTGRVPFNGDTTVAIAIKHIQDPLPTPTTFNDEIPVSVEKIVLKCCQKSPDRRYQSAAELIKDLKRSLITPDEDFVSLVDPDEEGATRVASEEERDTIRDNAPKMSETERMRLNEEYQDAERKDKKRPARYDDDDQYRGNDTHKKKKSNDYDDDYDDYGDAGSGMEKATVVMAIIAAVLVALIALLFIGQKIGVWGDSAAEESTAALVSAEAVSEASTQTVSKTVPNVVGLSFAEAKNILEQQGYIVDRQADTDNKAEKNVIASQSPVADTQAERGSTVTIYVSDGSNYVKGQEPASASNAATKTATTAASAATVAATQTKVSVPNVIGMTEEDATIKLAEAGLSAGTIVEVNNDDPNLTDKICNQSETVGAMVEPGTAINLERSIGPANVSYSYAENIAAPTEGENYADGLEVAVTLVTQDGTSLLNTTTTSFPISVNFSGISSPTGILTFKYTSTPPTTTDPETGEAVAGEPQEITVTRAVTFTQEN